MRAAKRPGGRLARSIGDESELPAADRGLTERDRAVEAGAAAGVAAAAVPADPDLQPKGVLVAIDAHLGDRLGLSAGRPFAPEFLAGAGPIPGLPGLDGLGERLGVHVRDHQHFACRGLRDDAGEKAVWAEPGRQDLPLLEVGLRARRFE